VLFPAELLEVTNSESRLDNSPPTDPAIPTSISVVTYPYHRKRIAANRTVRFSDAGALETVESENPTALVCTRLPLLIALSDTR